MSELRRWIQTFAVLLLVAGSTAPARAQGGGLQCSANAAVVPTLRAEGLTELVGDVVLNCVGGTPTPAGDTIPQTNVTLSLAGTITSRSLGSATDALLLIDDPSPSNQTVCPTPSTGCAVTGEGGIPSFNAPGLTNVYQGILSGPNAITFYGIPLEPPESGGSRVYRITNVRTNATDYASGGPTPVQSFIATTDGALPISNPQPIVGFASKSLNFNTVSTGESFQQCQSYQQTVVGTVTYTENSSTAFKTRVAGAQNQPGFEYYTESGLIITTAFGTAGLADFGTRFTATLSNLPSGVTVYVDQASSSSVGGRAVLVASAAAPDPGTGLPPDPGNGVSVISNGDTSTATVVWEVISANASSIDTFTFNIYISSTGGAATTGSATPNVTGGLGPNFAGAPGTIPAFEFFSNPPANLFTISACAVSNYTISGQVTYNGSGLGGVAVQLSGSQSASAITNAGGNYSFTVPGGNYIVTPSLTGYTFSPSSRNLTNLSSNQTANFTASAATPTLVPTPASLTFHYMSGGSQPSSQTLTISSSASSSQLSFTVDVNTSEGGNWLSASPTSGTTSANLTVSMNAAVLGGLAVGTYNGSITITSTGAGNSPLSVPVTLSVTQASNCVPFSGGYVPFSKEYYITTPDSAGDLLFVGQMTIANYEELNNIPLPNAVNQQFCGLVYLAPGISAQAYVPTAAERTGNFSAFAGLLIDPVTNQPFPGGIIPASRIPDPFAWRVSQASMVTAPAITSLSPTSVTAGAPPFTLTVNGSNFTQCAAAPCLGVNWQPATGGSTFISGQANAAGTQLTATIPTALISAVGTVSVSVQAAGGTSSSLPFTVGNPAPTITSLSPASATAGGAAFTLTVSGFGFVQCAASACLGVNWQPVTGDSTFISGQANTAGTQLTASIPAGLIATAGTASLTIQAAGGTSNSVPFIIAGAVTTGSPTGAGHLLFPNVGLNALQEFDPVKLAVVNTIPLPAPFTYSGSLTIETARIRKSDGGILTNVYTNGTSAVLALSSAGQFVAAEEVPNPFVQQLVFDPLDSTQSTVLAGSPFSPDVIAVSPYSGSLSTRISQQGANFIGLATDLAGRLYTGNFATGQVYRYLPDGTQGSLFADVLKATGTSDINALAIDSNNNLYVAQNNSNQIAKFDSTGTFVGLLSNPAFNQNAYLFFNPNDGLLYAGNQADDVLTILTTAGTPVATVHMGGKTVGVPDVVPGSPAPIQGSMETTLTGLTFQTPQSGSAPPPQSFAVVNNTSATFSFTTSVTTTSGGSWLTVTGGSGSVSAGQVGAPITVSVNPSGLAPGDYYGTIEIDAAGVANSPQFVTVVLNILPATANPGASVSPTGMIFTAVVNGTNPAAQSVAVSDVLSRSTSFTATGTTITSPSWFTVTPSQGTIQPGQPMNIQVQPNVTNLAPGVYSGTLTLQFPQDNVTRQIALLLVVATSATEIAQDKYAPRQAIIPCQPTQLLMVFTQLGAGFSQYASWPTTLEAFVVDDCGVPMVSGSVTVTFSDGEAALPLISQDDGSWSQTWSPSGATSSLTLTATAVNGGLQGSTQIGGAVQANPNIPVLNAGGMVSGASFSPIAIPSPGEIVSIFGSNLADGPQAAAQLPLPTQMQNAFVLLGTQTMPLLYVSPTQINAVMPYGLTGGTAYQAVARHGSRLSVPQRIAVAAADPAVFTPSGKGQGQGHIYIEPGNILAGSSTPATAGDTLTMYCTGLGAVTQPVTAGSAAPSQPLAYTAGTVSVTIGGQPATVPFAGLAPGFAGLYQINAKVPSGVPTGDQIPVVIAVDGINSPVVTIAVK